MVHGNRVSRWWQEAQHPAGDDPLVGKAMTRYALQPSMDPYQLSSENVQNQVTVSFSTAKGVSVEKEMSLPRRFH
jgi:hypothetical protein